MIGSDRRPPSGEVEERELGCPACGHCWYADGSFAGEEHGVWFPTREDDLYCPVCGVEGV